MRLDTLDFSNLETSYLGLLWPCSAHPDFLFWGLVWGWGDRKEGNWRREIC